MQMTVRKGRTDQFEEHNLKRCVCVFWMKLLWISRKIFISNKRDFRADRNWFGYVRRSMMRSYGREDATSHQFR